MGGRHSAEPDKGLLGLAELAVSLVDDHPLASYFDRGVGRMTSEPSASSFSATQGAISATPSPSLASCFMISKLGISTYDVRPTPLFKKEILSSSKSDAIPLIEQEVLFLQIGRGDPILFSPWMQRRENEVKPVAGKGDAP